MKAIMNWLSKTFAKKTIGPSECFCKKDIHQLQLEPHMTMEP